MGDVDHWQDDGRLMLRSMMIGELADLLDTPTQDFEMYPAGEDPFVIRRPDEELWSPVKFYELADGSPYMHAGFRASPKR